jgi:predicted nucleotidyltransferase
MTMHKEEMLKFLKKFQEENKNKYHIEKLGIFGSFAKDTANHNSDIDIVVVLEKQDLFEIIGIKQALEEHLKSQVDIVSYRDKMNLFLKRRIDKEAIYV